MKFTLKFFAASLSLDVRTVVHRQNYSTIPQKLPSSRLGFGSERPKTRYRRRIISTLDVEHITNAHIFDLSFYKKPCIHTISRSEIHAFRLDYATDVRNEKSKYLVFPPRTEGFLYYHRRCNSLPGEVRFSLASTPDINVGMDLLLPNGLPWSIPLWYIVSAPKYKSLLQVLIANRLVGRELVQRCEWMFPPAWARRRMRSTVLVNWNDVFAVPLRVQFMKVWIAGEKGLKETMLQTDRILGRYAGDSTGCVHVRIEYDSVHEMDVVNVLRVQGVAGQVPLSLNRRVKPTLDSLTYWSKTHPYSAS